MPVIHLHQNPVRYQVDGAAGLPWLVFSNSLGTDLRMWDAQAAFFSRAFRVLRYDTRGHGGTGAGAGADAGAAAGITIGDLGRDVLALLDALDIERAHFCGLSMGGVIAQWLGIHAPQRLHKLVVANSAPRIGTAQGWHDRAALVRSTGMDAVPMARRRAGSRQRSGSQRRSRWRNWSPNCGRPVPTAMRCAAKRWPRPICVTTWRASPCPPC